MFLWVVICVFAAFGVLCALWACLGFLLPGQKGAVTVYCCHGQRVDALIRRQQWLRDMGLVSGRLIIVDCGITEQQRKLLAQKSWIGICQPDGLMQVIE